MSTWQIALAFGAAGLGLYLLGQIAGHLKALRKMMEWRNEQWGKRQGLWED